MGGVGRCECFIIFVSAERAGRSLLSLGWWGWAHDLHARPEGVVVDFVLESANAGGIS